MYDRVKMFPGLLSPPTRAIWKTNAKVVPTMPSMTCLIDVYINEYAIDTYIMRICVCCMNALYCKF